MSKHWIDICYPLLLLSKATITIIIIWWVNWNEWAAWVYFYSTLNHRLFNFSYGELLFVGMCSTQANGALNYYQLSYWYFHTINHTYQFTIAFHCKKKYWCSTTYSIRKRTCRILCMAYKEKNVSEFELLVASKLFNTVDRILFGWRLDSFDVIVYTFAWLSFVPNSMTLFYQ